MSTMMTPQAHIAALKGLHVSIGIESNKLAGVLSTRVPHGFNQLGNLKATGLDSARVCADSVPDLYE